MYICDNLSPAVTWKPLEEVGSIHNHTELGTEQVLETNLVHLLWPWRSYLQPVVTQSTTEDGAPQAPSGPSKAGGEHPSDTEVYRRDLNTKVEKQELPLTSTSLPPFSKDCGATSGGSEMVQAAQNPKAQAPVSTDAHNL